MGNEEKEKKGFFSRLVKGLTKTRDNIVSGIDSIFSGFSSIDEEFYEEIEEILIMGDLGVHATTEIIENLKEKVKEQHIKEPAQCKELLISSIREQMEALLGTEMYLYQGYCTAILGSPAYKNLSAYDLRSLTEYLEKMDLYAGLSYGFLNILEAARAFKQSMIAPGLRKRLTAGIHLARYEDVVFMHLIQIADEHGVPPVSFCHPVVKKVHQYDEEYGTEYLRTLTAYIHFNQGLQENADALYIHRNTMYKRIGFLKDYFQIDFDNHRLVMKLRVSTQVYSYMGWLNIQDINGPFE